MAEQNQWLEPALASHTCTMIMEDHNLSEVELLEFLVNFKSESRTRHQKIPLQETTFLGQNHSGLTASEDQDNYWFPAHSTKSYSNYGSDSYSFPAPFGDVSPQSRNFSFTTSSPLQSVPSVPEDQSIISDDVEYSDTMVECWEPGEILDGENSCQEDDVSSSCDGTPRPGRNCKKPSKKLSSPFDSSHRRGKKRGPRPKKLTKDEKRQKRIDANDRERQRMGKLNIAFDNLRHLLPKHGNDRELSKFETIQIAKNYIRSLHQLLAQTDPNYSGSICSDDDSSFEFSF